MVHTREGEVFRSLLDGFKGKGEFVETNKSLKRNVVPNEPDTMVLQKIWALKQDPVVVSSWE